MDELRDITGLDAIPVWPLGPAWWLIIAGLTVFAVVFGYRAYRYLKYRRSWQYTSFKLLESLEQQLHGNNTSDYKNICQQLAIELRRIAMQAFARETCAGLVGSQWLNWLQEHDPRQFAWQDNGQLLVDYQYMPTINATEKNKLQTLISAAKGWVEK